MLYSSYTMDTSGLPDMYTRGLRVYISVKPRVDMVYLICIIATPSGKQKAVHCKFII